MTPRRRKLTWTGVALAAVLSACGDNSVTRPEVPEQADVVVSRSGIAVPEPQMRRLLANVTREVAIALADPAVRAQVYRDLHASPYREHKLHFNTFLRSDAPSLLSAMAAARSAAFGAAPAPRVATPKEQVLATLDSIVDLEFYMPVKTHFAAWDGSANLLVATALRDDGRAPDGFDLAGRPVPLTAAEPPATPTLVVVPVETDFSAVTPLAPAGVDAATTDIAGVYMTRAVMYHDHEGWPNGNPEFEVHLFQTDVDMEYIDQICAGQQQVPPYQWNTQETQNWTGEVLLATEGRLALSPNNQFQMWEDDSQACAPGTAGRPPRADNLTISEMTSWASAFLGIVATATGNIVDIVKFLLNAVPAAFNFYVDASDDPVGVLTLANGCWPASGPVNFRIYASSNGHPETGWVTLDFRFGGTREPLCPPPPPPPPPPPLGVTISGPSDVQPYSNCLFMAIASGGTEPYTFAWTADGVPVGDGSPGYRHSAGTTLFNLMVVVTDGAGGQASSETSATVSQSAPECLDQ